MRMTGDEFDRERRYLTAAHFLRKMLADGLITEGEFSMLDASLCEKYRPVSGNLLSGMSLICDRNRVNMPTGKEAKSLENSD